MLFDAIILGLILGALCGVAPLVLGKFLGRPGLGMLGLLCSAFGGALLSLWVAILVAVTFSIVILAAKHDVNTAVGQPPVNNTPQIMCMNGPLQGQVYSITSEGLILAAISAAVSGSPAALSASAAVIAASVCRAADRSWRISSPPTAPTLPPVRDWYPIPPST